MEIDISQNDSDEGVELSAIDGEDGEEMPEYFHQEINGEGAILEAEILHVLLPKNLPISRATRFMWYLDRLNTIITIPTHVKIDASSTELEIISAKPKKSNTYKSDSFLITSNTVVKFIAHSYRFVYCLDMSPSQSAVNTDRGKILFEEVLNRFKITLEGLCRRFTIDGSSLIFQPSIYLTVIANTPFFMSPAQQVLVKGVKITLQNLQEIVNQVETQFHFLENRIAKACSGAHTITESTNGFDDADNSIDNFFISVPDIPIILPDTNFINMLRYSMLAISLLPENSLSHILVISDGVVGMPDNNVMESLLLQLHYESISVSFMRVGSKFHPKNNAGYVCYADFLQFISQATSGTTVHTFPEIKPDPSMSMNTYHKSFLFWTFHNKNKFVGPFHISNQNRWKMPESFQKCRIPLILTKRQTEDNINAPLALLLSRRMREGFNIDFVKFDNNLLEISMSIEWKAYIFIQYYIAYQWPVVKNVARVEVRIAAPYEFLHDITCLMKKESKSSYRQAVIERFWLRIQQLSSKDALLAQQLTSSHHSNIWYTLPENVKSGIPVFTLDASENNQISLLPTDVSSNKFTSMWLPICQIESNNWRKWFHTHKLSVVLKYDHPLPKHLHLANSSGRFQVVQCRQATTALYSMLAGWSSFVLIDNHTYLKLLYHLDDQHPTWFCIVRVIPKLPCAVITVAFVTGTPGKVRLEICESLKSELITLSYMSSPIKSKENMCCTLLQKPFERILIRYEKMPSDLTTVIFPDGTQPPNSIQNSQPFGGTLLTTLSRYLYHRRWIWSTSYTANPKLEVIAISRILSTLTKMRLKEGFSFAHSSSGITTMVLELLMKPLSSCVVQYVVFPPHRAWREGDCTSGSDEEGERESEVDSELQIVTEVWIEPQYGIALPTACGTNYFDNMQYHELADIVRKIDALCINSLLTLEHLNLICQNKSPSFVVDRLGSSRRLSTLTKKRKESNHQNSGTSLLDNISTICDNEERIEHVPFNFDPISILPLSKKTELLFSMFIENDKLASPKYNYQKSNELLLENIQDHLACLHDYELDITVEESDRLTQQILSRHQNKFPHYCPLSNSSSQATNGAESEELRLPYWKCYIKGVSVTHVILTFIPRNLPSLKKLMVHEGIASTPSCNDSSESTERASSRGSNFSDVPINVSNSLILPLYVFDCPLAALVHSFTENSNKLESTSNDCYEDHRFKFGTIVQEDCIRLKCNETTNGSPEPKSDESEGNENKSNIKKHCKALVLAHLKCFVMSLFTALQNGAFVHRSDVQSAMDQCEETVYNIDISQYMQTICGHLKQSDKEEIDLNTLKQFTYCNDLKPLHRLIKEKFLKIMKVAFSPIPNNREYYYYRSTALEKASNKCDSDDEISIPPSDGVEFRSDKEISSYSDFSAQLLHLDSTSSRGFNQYIAPLFVHLICTVQYNNIVSNTSVKTLPSCIGELIESIEFDNNTIKRSKLDITLDIMCLTLPLAVQNVMNDYSSQGLRSTSFCSDGFQTSIGSAASDVSFIPEFPNPINNLSDMQCKAIKNLREDIEWLLKDEIATALLDTDTVTSSVLNFVTDHVGKSAPSSSCIKDVIELNFVYDTNYSFEKFLEEFAKIKCTSYELSKEEEYYYLVKSPNYNSAESQQKIYPQPNLLLESNKFKEIGFTSDNKSDIVYPIDSEGEEYKMENFSQQSDLSSLGESYLETDGGYDEDVSDDEDDFDWLLHLDNKRAKLPNFWLIMQVDKETVTVFFHCRFLELPTTLGGTYLHIQRITLESVRHLCKKVNQSLLLQSLHDTRTCDDLLEPSDNESWVSDVSGIVPVMVRNSSYSRLKSMDEVSDEAEHYPTIPIEASFKFKPGYFSCPMVWQTHFILHPRLKSGPGKSRGVLSLKSVLDKFSVTNRNNMFVYRDIKSNVFYLRLYESISNFQKGSKDIKVKSNEYEHAVVSRSPSIASLPLGTHKSLLTASQQSIASTNSRDSDIRPRVRSFGEKEIKDNPSDDTLILRVHGITAVEDDIRCDLTQVLQNRLDDGVLEFLSVMLARNVKCPLTPEDVHFLQKPFRPPDVKIKLDIQEYALYYLDSFVYYLQQNLMQFLNIPKYTDSRSHYHFKDYSEPDQSKYARTDQVFLYNQSQNPSSGSRGIACIAFAIFVPPDAQSIYFDKNFEKIFNTNKFEDIILAQKLSETDDSPKTYLEFRLWMQGRVNTENLSQKLKNATSQAMWDIIIEYYILRENLCVKDTEHFSKVVDSTTRLRDSMKPINNHTSREIECPTLLPINFGDASETSQTKNFEVPKVLISAKRPKRYIPLNSSARRSLLFDEYQDRQHSKDLGRKNTILLDPFELGDDGVMTKIYSKTLFDWLEYGFKIDLPSVKKTKINFTNRHLINVTIREFQNVITQLSSDSTKVFSCLPVEDYESANYQEVYVPYNPSYMPQNVILIARNFEVWKAWLSENLKDYKEMFNSTSLKFAQKFSSNVDDNSFIPRQKILWALIESDNILVYSYNWSKDSLDKLVEVSMNLGSWLSIRGGLLNSATSQKLGIFYNQPLVRNTLCTTPNPFMNYITDVECMMKFSRDKPRRQPSTGISGPSLWMFDVFRDMYKSSSLCHTDPVVVIVLEMHELKRTDKKHKDELKKLHSMWQSRTSSCTPTQIQILKQNSRLIHFCHTPLLFLSKWRIESASTRDYSLIPPTENTTLLQNCKEETADNWYKNLCSEFITEYKRYLHTLKQFIPLQIESKKHGLSKLEVSNDSIYYVQKTILGGIIIFTIHLNEPFLITKLYAIECSKLQSTSSRTSINQFTTTYLDECDKIKIAMHLHSFTYDFHLRCIHNYIANSNNGSKVCDGYHLTNFLDDFLKYYNKAPNFARNLVHEDVIIIQDLLTEGKQLFDYLLMNVTRYSMDLRSMSGEDCEDTEYVLVKISNTPQLSYKDSQDFRHTDDFNVTLIVTRLFSLYESQKNVLHLKYYLILTSRGEIYPKSDVDRTLGEFRTVSLACNPVLGSTSTECEVNEDVVENEVVIEKNLKMYEERKQSVSSGPGTYSHIEIKRESVNYMGYYSSHEELMQQLILDQASIVEKNILDIVNQGMVDCRTHLLWNKLVSSQESSQLTFSEFVELKGLAKSQNICEIHPNLGSLLDQSVIWYQGLAKLLSTKYGDQTRIFVSSDGNIQHYVILHPRYDGGFMMLSMDLHTSRGSLYAVHRTSHKHKDSDICVTDRKTLLDGFVNTICFYIWMGLI